MPNWLIYFVDRSMANVLDRGKILQHMEIALELKEERKMKNYGYEETPIRCEDCNAQCFAIVRNLERARQIVRFVCPVCEQELHYALLSLTGQIEE